MKRTEDIYNGILPCGRLANCPSAQSENKKKKVYISLPITGREPKDVYAQANEAFNRLTLLGYDAISPLDNGLPWDAPHEQHMKKDIQTLMDCDAIYLCDGYTTSSGCKLEVNIARMIAIPRLYYSMEDERIKYMIG